MAVLSVVCEMLSHRCMFEQCSRPATLLWQGRPAGRYLPDWARLPYESSVAPEMMPSSQNAVRRSWPVLTSA